MIARKSKSLITERALRDIAAIENYSVKESDKRVANRYLSDIESALIRIQADRDILQAEQELHPNLRLYRVNQHLLVCDVQPKSVFLLTVIRASQRRPRPFGRDAAIAIGRSRTAPQAAQQEEALSLPVAVLVGKGSDPGFGGSCRSDLSLVPSGRARIRVR